GQISNAGQTFGGPSSLQVLPTAAFKTQQTLLPILSGSVNFVIIVAPNSAVASLQLNGVPSSSSFAPLPGGEYQWAFAFPFLSALSGPATFTADAPIAVYSTGFGIPPVGSFAYPVAF
ncbi:MAG: hypothetical protein WBW33_00845, partial [Bryobacteraceae bacterium]